jgi:hypothetical protein
VIPVPLAGVTKLVLPVVVLAAFCLALSQLWRILLFAKSALEISRSTHSARRRPANLFSICA